MGKSGKNPPRWTWGFIDFYNCWKQVGLRGALWVTTPRWLARIIGNPCAQCGRGYFTTQWGDYHDDCFLAFIKERTK